MKFNLYFLTFEEYGAPVGEQKVEYALSMDEVVSRVPQILMDNCEITGIINVEDDV